MPSGYSDDDQHYDSAEDHQHAHDDRVLTPLRAIGIARLRVASRRQASAGDAQAGVLPAARVQAHSEPADAPTRTRPRSMCAVDAYSRDRIPCGFQSYPLQGVAVVALNTATALRPVSAWLFLVRDNSDIA